MYLPFRKPSLKKLKEVFGEQTGKRLRETMDLATYPASAIKKCDKILGGHGVERIPAGHNQKSPAIEYVNMGDPYTQTIMMINGNLVAGSWGSIVESGNYD